MKKTPKQSDVIMVGCEPDVASSISNNTLDVLSLQLFGKSRSEVIRQEICVTCGAYAIDFEDALSAKEFTISGLCQKCQNEVFGGEQ